MKPLSFFLILSCIGCAKSKNPDLHLMVQTMKMPMGDEYERVVLENRSWSKVYTVKVRQGEKKKTGRVYTTDSSYDVVSDKVDAMSKVAQVVVPPRKWRLLGSREENNYSGVSKPGDVQLYQGSGSIFTYKILSWQEGGDVNQVRHHSDPFGPEWTTLLDGSVESSQGDIQSR